jgi:hypothetical protein
MRQKSVKCESGVQFSWEREYCVTSAKFFDILNRFFVLDTINS